MELWEGSPDEWAPMEVARRERKREDGMGCTRSQEEKLGGNFGKGRGGKMSQGTARKKVGRVER